MLTKTQSLFILGCLLSTNQIYCMLKEKQIPVSRLTTAEVQELIKKAKMGELPQGQEAGLTEYLQSQDKRNREFLTRDILNPDDPNEARLILSFTPERERNSEARRTTKSAAKKLFGGAEGNMSDLPPLTSAATAAAIIAATSAASTSSVPADAIQAQNLSPLATSASTDSASSAVQAIILPASASDSGAPQNSHKRSNSDEITSPVRPLILRGAQWIGGETQINTYTKKGR